jgi:hypothetical protein
LRSHFRGLESTIGVVNEARDRAIWERSVKLAAQRPRTVVILTLPSEQDANRKLTGELKQHIPTVLETVDEVSDTAGRQAKNLTPTQSNERAAVLGRRLFERVKTDKVGEVASAFVAYYEAQRQAGVTLDGRAFAEAQARMGRCGQEYVRGHLSWEQIGRSIARAYAPASARPGGPGLSLVSAAGDGTQA